MDAVLSKLRFQQSNICRPVQLPGIVDDDFCTSFSLCVWGRNCESYVRQLSSILCSHPMSWARSTSTQPAGGRPRVPLYCNHDALADSLVCAGVRVRVDDQGIIFEQVRSLSIQKGRAKFRLNETVNKSSCQKLDVLLRGKSSNVAFVYAFVRSGTKEMSLVATAKSSNRERGELFRTFCAQCAHTIHMYVVRCCSQHVKL